MEARTYIAFYRKQQKPIVANTSYEAQKLAAQLWKAKNTYEVTVVLADVPVDPASI